LEHLFFFLALESLAFVFPHSVTVVPPALHQKPSSRWSSPKVNIPRYRRRSTSPPQTQCISIGNCRSPLNLNIIAAPFTASPHRGNFLWPHRKLNRFLTLAEDEQTQMNQCRSPSLPSSPTRVAVAWPELSWPEILYFAF